MSEIEDIFRSENDVFTVFVVEQRFVANRGHAYFHSFLNKENYFDSDEKIKKQFRKIISTIEKSVAPVSKLVSIFSSPFQIINISEIITSLCKIFTVNEHQAAGPDVIDPIILQEGRITYKSISRLVHLHKDSILRPSIIILLKDNDFNRAKKLLSECPNGINVKMIRNSGEETIYKIVNCGAEDLDSFITSFAEQCYSTCSKTKREVLLNANWSDNIIISRYSPRLLRYRTNLLFDEKEDIRADLTEMIMEISSDRGSVKGHDEYILQCIECMAKLYRVFCNDFGGNDMIEAERLARAVGNEVLLARVYCYAELLPNCSQLRQNELYETGYAIFKKFGMEDHAIYCMNNKLVQQFYSDHVFPEQFRELQVEAVNNVPGMVGMSHIYNNVGVAYLYVGSPALAIDFFNKGLNYAVYQDRIVQSLALESNKIIAESYAFSHIEENRIRMLMARIFDGMGLKRLPFLSADFVVNILSVAFKQNPRFGNELLNSFPIKELLDTSFRRNPMGATERILQLKYLACKYSEFPSTLASRAIPKGASPATGKRTEFITRYGFSPFDFNTWL